MRRLKFILIFFYYKKYPVGPSFFYSKYEEECHEQNNYPLFDEKGILKKTSLEEERLRKENIKNCIKKIDKQREKTKQNDVWTSFMLVFLGGGILYTKRFYLKES